MPELMRPPPDAEGLRAHLSHLALKCRQARRGGQLDQYVLEGELALTDLTPDANDSGLAKLDAGDR